MVHNTGTSNGVIDVDVAIIGAGPAGLTAGYLLTKQGKTVAIIEKDETYVGGISRTVEHEGYRFDIGGHRFFSKSQAVVDLWNEILPDDFIQRPRMSRIYYEGKFYSYPLRAFEALGNLGILRSTACMVSYLRYKLFPIKDVKSFEDWTTNQFGKKLYSIFFKTYTEKVWGMPCDEMSADWAAQRIKGLSLWSAVTDGLKRSLGLNKKPNDGQEVKTLLETFRYPRLGPGMMWKRCTEKVIENGGEVQMNTKVVQVNREGMRVTSIDLESWDPNADPADKSGNKTTRYEADEFVNTMAMRDLLRCMQPPPPQEVLDAADKLSYRDFMIVTLVLDEKDPFPDNWIYIHSSDIKCGRIQNFRAWSPEMLPDQNTASIGMEYFCQDGDDLWNMEDDDLTALASRELEELGLASASNVIGSAIIRQPKAYPVYDEEYQGALAVIRGWMEKLENFQTVGRNGLHRYNNQDHSMLSAMLAARNIVGETHNVWDVNVERSYHEEFQISSDEPNPEVKLSTA